MVFWTLLSLVVVTVAYEFLRPKPNIEDARPAGIGQFQVPTSTEDRVQPVIFGRVLLKGPNVVWYDDLFQEPIVEEVKTGLFTKESFVKGYRYNLGMQFELCRGPDVTLHGVRVGEKEASTTVISGEGRFDINDPEFFGGDDLGSGGLKATCDFYPGSLTQSVNAYLDTAERQRITVAATPTAPRHVGKCHVVARQLTGAAPTAGDRGAYLGNSTSIAPWHFDVSRFPGTFDGQAVGQNKVGANDCNPINVIYEILTNTEWGRAIPASDIDVGVGSTFLKASGTMLAEGNGFSMSVDTVREVKDVMAEILRQIDGRLFTHPNTGKWTIQLVREASDVSWGYDINTVPQFDDDSIVDLRDFSPGSWTDTTNQVQARYTSRADEYTQSFAPAQNGANGIMLAGGSFTEPEGSMTITSYPGVMNAALANDLAWRDLRAFSRPLKKATFVVQRVAPSLVLGNVVAWTDPSKGFVKVPMRVTKIDYGTLEDNRMVVTAWEDVFRFATGSYGNPNPSKWTPPTIELAAFPAGEQLAIEAPRAVLVRDPAFSGDDAAAKILFAARRQGSETAIQASQRNAAGTPAGSYAVAGSAFGFVKVGELASAVAAGTAIPTTTITVAATPDSQVDIESAFDDSRTQQDLGADLAHLVVVGTEFMLVSSAANNGGDVDLQDVYRGALDSGQQSHAAGTDVFLLFAGASISDTGLPNTNNVDVRLRMRSPTAVFSGSVTDISFQMDKRALRPYPPAAFEYNGTSTAFGTPNMEGDGSGLNGVGFDVDLRRRRYDTADEVQELLQDNAVSASTEHRVRVFVDPTGSNDLAYDSGWFTGAAPAARPTQAQVVTHAAAGTTVRVQSESRHDIASETNLESRHPTLHDVVPTTTRSSQFYLGGDLQANQGTNSYVAASTGTFTVNIGAAYSTSNVQARINGGSWTTVVAAGLTTGTIVGVNSSDTIELRHTVNETPDPNFVEITDPVATPVAYGAFSA